MRWFACLFVTLLLFSSFVAAQFDDVASDTSGAADRVGDEPASLFEGASGLRNEGANQFFDNLKHVYELPVFKQLGIVLFGIYDLDFFDKMAQSVPQIFGITKVSTVIIFFFFWLITLVVMKDILEIAAPFSQGVTWLVALGLTIVVAQLGGIVWVSVYMIGFVATLGAASVWIFLLLLFGLFLLTLLGNNLLQKVALKMRIIKETNRSQVGAGEVSNAISGLRKIEQSLN